MSPSGSPRPGDPQLPVCLVLLGRQGSGKGTQSQLLCDKFGLVHVSTGDLLRDEAESGSELGQRVKQLMDAGELVSDDLMCEILGQRIARPDVLSQGVLLDGFPRTVGQAESLAAIAGTVHGVINLDVSIDEVTDRMLLRNRDDDTRESIGRRLALYEEQTEPLLEWYQTTSTVRTVDGLGEPDEVFVRLATVVKEMLDAAASASDAPASAAAPDSTAAATSGVSAGVSLQ